MWLLQAPTGHLNISVPHLEGALTKHEFSHQSEPSIASRTTYSPTSSSLWALLWEDGRSIALEPGQGKCVRAGDSAVSRRQTHAEVCPRALGEGNLRGVGPCRAVRRQRKSALRCTEMDRHLGAPARAKGATQLNCVARCMVPRGEPTFRSWSRWPSPSGRVRSTQTKV